MTDQTRISLSAALISFVAVYLLIAGFARGPVLNDPDTFWHIRVGEWILTNRQFPVSDVYSYTALGNRWIATDWLSEIALATVFKLGQWWAVTETIALASGFIAAVLCFYLTRTLRLSVALGTTAIIIALISPHFLARPAMFSYCLLSLWIVITLEIEDRALWTRWSAFVLVPLMLLWANIHASFTFGLVAFYVFALFALYRAFAMQESRNLYRIVLLIGAVSAAALATPYGLTALLRNIELMRIPALGEIVEWRAPDFQTDKLHLASIVGIFAVLVYFGIKLQGPRLLTLLLVTIFALEHVRGLGVFGLVAPLIVARPISDQVPFLRALGVKQDPLVRVAHRRSMLIAVCCMIPVFATALGFRSKRSQIRPPISIAPEAAISAARQAGLSGNVLNSHAFGGYLIFLGIPPFVDGRVELYGNRFLRRYFDVMSLANMDDASHFLEDYDIRWALLRPDEPIVKLLISKGWTKLYHDRYSVVLAKKP